MQLKRTEAEVDELLNKVAEAIDNGERKFRAMSYEEGIDNAIRWLIGEIDDHPYED